MNRLMILILFLSVMKMFLYAEDIELSSFLEHARKNHPTIKKERLQVKIEKMDQRSLQGNSDAFVSVTPYYTYSKPLDSATSFIQVKRIRGKGINFETRKKLWLTGSEISLSFDANRKEYHVYDKLSGSYINENEFVSKTTLSLIQPLLKNFRSRLDKIEYDLKTYDISIAKINAVEKEEDFIIYASSKFLEWILQDELVAIAEKRVALAEKMHGKNYRKYRANLIDRVDFLRSDAERKMAKQLLVSIKSDWKAKQAELAVFSGDSTIYRKTPQYPIYKEIELNFPDNVLTYLRKNSRVLKILRKEMIKLQTAYRASWNAMLPDISLKVDGTLYNDNQRFKSLASTRNPELFVGITFSMPLGNNEAAGRYDKLEMEIKQLEHGISEVERKMEAEMTSLIVRIKEYSKILKMNKNQIQINKMKTAEEIRQYYRGRGNYLYIIESLNQEEESQQLYAENAVTYHTLVLNYKALSDKLIKNL